MSFEEVIRPWGTFRILYQNPGKTITVKLIKVSRQSRLSLQYHRHRREEWLCLFGRANVMIGLGTNYLNVGERVLVPAECIHRLGTDIGTVILEVAYSDGQFDEADIVRLKDDYNRVGV